MTSRKPTTTSASQRRARPPERAWFASDLHLHGGDPDGVERACRFVRAARSEGVDALFLLGDVFRAWLGPRSLHDPGLAPFLDELRHSTAAGVRVVLLEGNHDFMVEHGLETALGVESPGDEVDVALGGSRARLVHGDVFCTRDRGYHRLHAVIRSAPFRWMARSLPRALADRVARALLRGANRNTARKSRAEMGIVDAEVATVLGAGVDVVICGHVHEARDEALGRGGRLVVLADFETTGSHAVWRDGRLVLHARDARFAPARGPVVTIDGPAGSGKTAVARALAARLGFVTLDSGALYRAVTARALRDGIALLPDPLAALVASLSVEIDEQGRVVIDGMVVPDAELRGEAVSAHVSQVSAVGAVRAALLPVQRGLADGGRGVVAEGRDMGTVVFPDAVLAVYLDARLDVRARRRLAQGPTEGRDAAAVEAALAARDARDRGRASSPLRPAPGAVVLDTSELALEEVVDRVEALVRAARRAAGRAARA